MNIVNSFKSTVIIAFSVVAIMAGLGISGINVYFYRPWVPIAGSLYSFVFIYIAINNLEKYKKEKCGDNSWPYVVQFHADDDVYNGLRNRILQEFLLFIPRTIFICIFAWLGLKVNEMIIKHLHG